LAGKVYTVERIEPLADRARRCLQTLDIDNVEVKVYDGGYGWPEHGPYDGIVVTAAAPEIPAPLKAQLKNRANLIVPVGPRWQQELIRVQRIGNEFVEDKLAPVAFVPLIGEHGWSEAEFYD
jgi:protein-L-isoaspartate(D-aspartate) O-methyltransferase